MIRMDENDYNSLLSEYHDAPDKDNLDDIACYWLQNNEVIFLIVSLTNNQFSFKICKLIFIKK